MDSLKNKVIFRYKTQPSFGIMGTYGGYELILFDNGHIEYITYVFPQKVNGISNYKVDDTCVSMIMGIVEKNADNLPHVETRLNSGILDGSLQEIDFFDVPRIFGNSLKRINIASSSLCQNEVKIINTIVDVLDEIKECLSHYGILIEPFEVRIGE